MTVSTFFRMLGGILLFTGMVGCTQSGSSSDDSSAGTLSVGAASRQGAAFVEDDESDPTILHIAMQSDDHSTLVAAVQAADLENSLVNQGPLMVFAPTNTAFDALPPGTVEDLLKPVNKDKLAFILKYHVTPGNYSKDFLKRFQKLGQANNQDVLIRVDGEEVYVGDARIIASIPASNGIIHVVDKVILPPVE